MKKLPLITVIVFCCVFCSCTQYSQGGYEFDAGVTVDINDLDSLFETTPQAAESTPFVDAPTDSQQEITPTQGSQPTTQPNIDENETVYWTKSGTKYHIYSDCQSLKKSTNVESGTLEEANASKKTECCKYCSNRLSEGK